MSWKQWKAAAAFAAALATAPALAAEWVAFDAHTHTHITDGVEPMTAVVENASKYGLGVWANSEHGGKSATDDHGRPWTKDGVAVPFLWRWQTLQDYAWPLLSSLRPQHPDMLLVQGVEWNVPTHEHASVGIVNEADGRPIAAFEYQFDASDADASRAGEPGIAKLNKTHLDSVEAVKWLKATQPMTSYFLVNHPSRRWRYGASHLRDYSDVGGGIAVGLEGFPGHQREVPGRGGYGAACSDPATTAQDALQNATEGCKQRTYGGADWMLAKVGGLMDSLWGEGRKFWAFVDSDFHDTEADFWPGEYAKTWIHVEEKTPAGFVEGLRNGNLYPVQGDLIDGLELRAARKVPGKGGWQQAAMGGTLFAAAGDDVKVRFRLRSPAVNAHGDVPAVDHVDVIFGELTGPVDRASDSNPTTKVLRRIPASELEYEDGWLGATVHLKDVQKGFYVRLRGTNLPVGTPGQTDADGNPILDPLTTTRAAAEAEAWSDLWFYSNPVFVEVR